jgi:outer membrane protein OmpA-like peptidoglycan-associated protein
MNKTAFFFIFIVCYLRPEGYSQINRDTTITLYFKTDSFRLDNNQMKRLIDFASFFHVKSITAYADSTGPQGYNLILSKKRGFAAYKVLSERIDSLNKGIMTYTGESTEEPELWKNRRVQIIAYQNTATEIKENLKVDTQTVVRSFDLQYVFFVPDQAIVTQESIPYIKELAEILKTYKTETFEIVGHINYQSRFDSTHLTDLYQLSERRAKAVYDYLESHGISPSRMTFKGVGNSQPIYPSPVDDEQRRKNMRVQIIIREK